MGQRRWSLITSIEAGSTLITAIVLDKSETDRVPATEHSDVQFLLDSSEDAPMV